MSITHRFIASACVLASMLVAGLSPAVARAQDGQMSTQRLVEDFNHYVFIDRHDLAEGFAQAILDSGVTPREFLAIIEDAPRLEDRFLDAVRRAEQVNVLEDEAEALLDLYEQGRLGRARDVQEINRNIELLSGTARQRLFARERLREAGEFAVPQLLNVVLDADDIAQRNEAIVLLSDMGRDALMPLTVALPNLRPQEQQTVLRIIGGLEADRRVLLPYLYQAHENAGVPATRDAARAAILRVAGEFNEQVQVADLFRSAAERFYNDRFEGLLLAFPNEEQQYLWEWLPDQGLFPTAILTPLWHEALAMRHAEAALERAPEDDLSSAIWLAANISRSIDEPADYQNPAYPPDRPSVDFYAIALGNTIAQRVLARALRDDDVQIARAAINAMQETAGGATLWQGLEGERPLLDALSYGNRQLRYDAALALASADPRESFRGSQRVVPTLAGMVSQAAERYALVVSTDLEFRQSVAEALEADGYTVLAPVNSLGQAELALAEAPSVDLMVVKEQPGDLRATIRSARDDERFVATPILGVTSGQEFLPLRRELRSDNLTRLLRTGVTPDELTTGALQLVTESVGAPLDDQEATEYANRALDALTQLAVSRNSVLNVDDAYLALRQGLREEDEFLRLRVAEVMSYINRAQAQQALASAAEDAVDPVEQSWMLNQLAASARRHGMLVDRAVAQDIRPMLDAADTGVRTAAAAALGAMNLTSAAIVPVRAN